MITPSSWGNVNRTFTAITLAGTSKRNFDERSKKQNPFEKANMRKGENCKNMKSGDAFVSSETPLNVNFHVRSSGM